MAGNFKFGGVPPKGPEKKFCKYKMASTNSFCFSLIHHVMTYIYTTQIFAWVLAGDMGKEQKVVYSGLSVVLLNSFGIQNSPSLPAVVHTPQRFSLVTLIINIDFGDEPRGPAWDYMWRASNLIGLHPRYLFKLWRETLAWNRICANWCNFVPSTISVWNNLPYVALTAINITTFS